MPHQMMLKMLILVILRHQIMLCSCVIDTRILMNVWVYFTFHTSTVSLVELEPDSYKAVLCLLFVYCSKRLVTL